MYGQKYHRLLRRKASGEGERKRKRDCEKKNQRKKRGTEREREREWQFRERRVIKTIRREERSFLCSSRYDGLLCLDRDDATKAAFSKPVVVHARTRTHILTHHLAHELLPNVYLCINGALTPGRRRNGVKYNAEFA